MYTTFLILLGPGKQNLSEKPGARQRHSPAQSRAIAALGKGIPFLIVYYRMDGGGGWQSLDRPLRTLTTLDRFGLVEWDGTEPTLRMLQVPELKRAMGYDDSYKLLRGSRRDRIKLLGNGVCPPVMQHIVSTLAGAAATTKPMRPSVRSFHSEPEAAMLA